MKTLDWVKQHVQEWPEGCTHITVDDSGEIWINEGEISKSPMYMGAWSSNYNNSIGCEVVNGKLEDNSKPILKEDFEIVEDEPTMKHTVQNGDHVYTKDLSPEQYEMLGDALEEAGFVGEYPDNQYHRDFDNDWVFGVDTDGENFHGDYSDAEFKNGRHLSFGEFMSNLQGASTSPSEPSTVQRISLAHKACLSACQEAVEAYNVYKQAVEDLKTEAGKGFKIEELTWEEFFEAVDETKEPKVSKRIWEDGDLAAIQDVVDDTHGFLTGQQVILKTAQATNRNRPAAICEALDSKESWFVLHENLSFLDDGDQF